MSTAADQSRETTSTACEPALPLRGDTFLGVCEAIGQDFGFNPNLLRALLAALLLWNAEVIIGFYLGLAIVVAAARLLFPPVRTSSATTQDKGRPKDAGEDLPLAA